MVINPCLAGHGWIAQTISMACHDISNINRKVCHGIKKDCRSALLGQISSLDKKYPKTRKYHSVPILVFSAWTQIPSKLLFPQKAQTLRQTVRANNSRWHIYVCSLIYQCDSFVTMVLLAFFALFSVIGTTFLLLLTLWTLGNILYIC